MWRAVVNSQTGAVVCERCAVADSPWSRLRGLLGRDRLEPGEGLLVTPAPAIHMFFMRFAIDAVFVGRDMRVVALVEDLKPWRIARGKAAHAVFELATGAIRSAPIRVGDQLELRGSAEANVSLVAA